MKTNLEIGDKAYPADNSYLICLSDKTKDYRLAGTWEKEAVEVTIKSKPFDIVTTYPGLSNQTHSFVIVEYDGFQYMVLNRFHNSYEDMLEAKELMNSMMSDRYMEWKK